MDFLNQVSNWANAASGDYRPEIAWTLRILAAIIVFFIGYAIAKLISGLIANGVNRIPFIRSANESASSQSATIGSGVGKVVFYLLLLIVIAISLSMVGLTQVVEPVRNMWNQMLLFLPNLIGAAALIIFGLIFAGIVKNLVETVLVTARVDRYISTPAKDGTTQTGFSSAIAWIVYALIAIPAVIAGIGVLGIPTIATPLTRMLNEVLEAIPNIVAAGVLLVLAYIIAKAIAAFLKKVLPQTGVDAYFRKFGLLESESESGLTASGAIATVVMIAIMLFATVEATKLLNFYVLSDFVEIILSQGGQILFGTVIIIIGFVFAGLVGKILDAAGSGLSDRLADIVKYAIMVLSVILGLSRMGLDPDNGTFILRVAEYLVIGLAVAFGVGGAIAFGLGGKEWAGNKLQKWFSEKPSPATDKTSTQPAGTTQARTTKKT